MYGRGKRPGKGQKMKEATIRQIEAMKDQTFGVEVEMYHIHREEAAKVAAAYFSGCNLGGGNYRYTAGTNGYDCWSAWDGAGREWKFMSDSSVTAAGGMAELVTPILRYADMDILMGLLRKLRKAGARSNPAHGCGVHIHIGADGHDARSLRVLTNIMAAHERLLIKAVHVEDGRTNSYCHVTDPRFLAEVNAKKPKTMDQLADIWYTSQGCTSMRMAHYNASRYHMLNLHATFTKGTIEFRLFQFANPYGGRNRGIHCGELRAYICLCLALSQMAKQSTKASPKEPQEENMKFAMRTWMIRLGLVGDEFATVREHLMKRLPGNAAWRFGNPGQQAAVAV